MSFAGRRWRKFFGFELEGRVNGGGEEEEDRAADRERRERVRGCRG